jgi:DNA-binding transcriptional MerR regulator
MSEANRIEEKNKSVKNPQADLEMMYIDEYLREKGYSMSDLSKLPEHETKQLMIEACRYVSLKLAELESRARLRREIHDATQFS